MTVIPAARREALQALLAACRFQQKALAGGTAPAADAIHRLGKELTDQAVALGVNELRAAAEAASRASGPLLAPTLALLEQRLTMLLQQIPAQELTILIVDDDPGVAALLRPLLTAGGRRVLTAASGADALTCLAQEQVALIILDLVLPDMDGRNLLIALRENLATESIPVIVISGNATAADTLECFALGADACYTKPFDPARIAAEVTAKLQRALRTAATARRDALTGLPNRAAFLEAFTLMLTHSRRASSPLAVSMLDIDRFKGVNDTYGHPAGDQVLRRLAEVVGGALRKSDYFARYGGEEFILFFPDSSCRQAETALQKALDAVRTDVIRLPDGRSLSITFSAGLTDTAAYAVPADAIAAADKLLYAAKAGGRNRIVTPATGTVPAPRRVLLIDDDPLIAAIVMRTLSADGFVCTHAADAAAGLAAAADGGVALFIVDLHLPDRDGHEVVRELRARPATAAIPVIILTGTGNEADVVRSFDLGANDYVTKPFSPVELNARVRRLLR